MHTQIAVLFIGRLLEYPSTDEWINKIQHTHKMEYSSTTKEWNIDSYVGILHFIPTVRAPRAGPETSLSVFYFYSQLCCPWSLGDKSQSLEIPPDLATSKGCRNIVGTVTAKSSSQQNLGPQEVWQLCPQNTSGKGSPGTACVGVLLTIKSSRGSKRHASALPLLPPSRHPFRQSSLYRACDSLGTVCVWRDTGGVWWPEFCSSSVASQCVLWQELPASSSTEY